MKLVLTCLNLVQTFLHTWPFHAQHQVHFCPIYLQFWVNQMFNFFLKPKEWPNSFFHPWLDAIMPSAGIQKLISTLWLKISCNLISHLRVLGKFKKWCKSKDFIHMWLRVCSSWVMIIGDGGVVWEKYGANCKPFCTFIFFSTLCIKKHLDSCFSGESMNLLTHQSKGFMPFTASNTHRWQSFLSKGFRRKMLA